MTDQDQQPDLAAKVAQLQIEHRDLDAAIAALAAAGTPDLLQVARLKKRKLRLKDEIKTIQDLMIPDIIA
ncbi:DUF465 domain-containing protein [Allosphingosinicella vermicomposti]|uniref:DUF465 domain-containing protein n=1 Tax=Allosphingosinicella vermicomposti TaxID=614671 RepID=UPI000D10CD12|nr:DUF465 domain-containing protein [Allosphingosinicella vermicomposti]